MQWYANGNNSLANYQIISVDLFTDEQNSIVNTDAYAVCERGKREVGLLDCGVHVKNL